MERNKKIEKIMSTMLVEALKEKKKNLSEQSGDDGSEMDPSLRAKIERGDTPYKENPALPDRDRDGLPDRFEKIVATKRFNDVVRKVNRYTGASNIRPMSNQLQMLTMSMMSAYQQVVSIERNNKEYLENLAVDLVMKEFGITPDMVQFDAKLVSPGSIDTSKMSMNPEKYDEEEIEKTFSNVSPEEAENDLEQFVDVFEKFNDEVAKRRVINALIQGSSKKGHYMFELLPDELEAINPNLMNLYGVMMSVNDLLYWMFPDEQMLSQMSGTGLAGSEEINIETDPPTVIARAAFFPALVHELIKGVMELLGASGLPTDPEKTKLVVGQADTLKAEIWDLRFGPVFWEKFIEAYPDELFEDDMKLIQSYLFTKFSRLSMEEFKTLTRAILSGNPKGKQILKRMVDEIVKQLQEEEYEQKMYKDDDEDDGPDLSFLSDLGIDI